MRTFILSLATLVLAGCAYVGDPLPPALKVPSPVTDLAARQVGAEILVTFTIPPTTMEGLVLSQVGGVELKIGESPAPPFNPEPWSSTARRVEATADKPGKIETRIAARDWARKEVVIGVRLANARNRVSPWSNFVTLTIAPPLDKPSQLLAVASAAGTTVSWSNPNPQPGRSWKVFRQSAGENEPTEMATVQQPAFLDTGAAYDVAHRYTVIAAEGQAVSESSDAVVITPVDTFAPAAPQGLSALAGPAAAQLSWERNQEPDFALYRIYRASTNGAFTRLAESPSAANYRDATVAAGQTYRYAVSAVDKKGNESPKSEPVEILIP